MELRLTDAMENMKAKGSRFFKGEVIEWLDCGNKDATVYTNQRVLEFLKNENNVSAQASIENSTIIAPCYIEENVVIKNSVVGPHVSISKGTLIESSVIKNSIIQSKSIVKNKLIAGSMIGNNAKIEEGLTTIAWAITMPWQTSFKPNNFAWWLFDAKVFFKIQPNNKQMTNNIFFLRY